MPPADDGPRRETSDPIGGDETARRPREGVHPLDDPDDAAALAAHAAALLDAARQALPRWVERSIDRVLAAQGIAVGGALRERIDAAAAAAGREGTHRLRALLTTDIDEQAGTPLGVVRSLVRYPTEVLREAGARPAARDEFAERSFPDDAYDLTPASLADVDPVLAEPGLVWGAAKAHVHLARRRREGRR